MPKILSAAQSLANKTLELKNNSEKSLNILLKEIENAQSKINSCSGGSCSEKNPCGGSCADKVKSTALDVLALINNRLEPVIRELIRIQKI